MSGNYSSPWWVLELESASSPIHPSEYFTSRRRGFPSLIHLFRHNPLLQSATEKSRRCVDLKEKEEIAANSFIYTNWRGKSFIIDERFARAFRNFLIEDGLTSEEVAFLTPEKIMEYLPTMEKWDRHFKLEETWELPEAKADR
jgi:hypothetical protein